MDEKTLAKTIYMAWMRDERFERKCRSFDMSDKPQSYFWAEVAARAVLEHMGDASNVRPR